MFSLFKKKTKREVLLGKYKKLMKESHALSSVNRREADDKFAEAEEIMKEVERLDNQDR